MLAFVILASDSAEQVQELITAIYNKDHTYVVHMDAKAPQWESAQLEMFCAGSDNIHFVPRQLCAWGSFSLVRVALACFEYLLVSELEWTHLVLLSESHYPLRRVDEIEVALTPGISYLDATQYKDFPKGAQEDISHRFARRYKEMEGVGSFSTGSRKMDLSKIYHSSQWVVLSRLAVDFLVKSYHEGGGLWGDFASSLLPDEIAFPTTLMNASTFERGDICLEGLTYVAWPHRTDNLDLVACAQTFEDARQTSCLFIRKRPPAPFSMVEYMIAGHDLMYTPKLRYQQRVPNVSAFCSAVMISVRRRYSEFVLTDYNGRRFSTTLQLSLRRPDWRDDYSVFVLANSEKEVKVLLLAKTAQGLEDVRIGAHEAHVLKVRVVDVQGRYCIDVGPQSSETLVLSAEPTDEELERLLSSISAHIKAADKINMNS